MLEEEGELEEGELVEEVEGSTGKPTIKRSSSGILLPIVEEEEEILGTSGTSGTSGTLGTSGTSGTSGPCVGRGTTIRLITRAPSYAKSPRPEDARLYLTEKLRQKPHSQLAKEPQTFDSLIIALNTMIEYNGEDEYEKITASEIVWDPLKQVIDKKIAASISKDYDLRCADYYFDQILEIRKEMHTWLLGNIHRRDFYREEHISVLVVDLANAYGLVQSLDIIFDMLIKIRNESFPYNVIILSIQNHNTDTHEFNRFTDKLKIEFGPANIYILTAHNRGSGDDLNCVLTIEILRILDIIYKFLTGDYLLDYKKFYEGYLRPIMLIPYITSEVIDPYAWFAVPGRNLAKRNSDLTNHMTKFLESINASREYGEKQLRDFTRSLPLTYLRPPPVPEHSIGYRGDSGGPSRGPHIRGDRRYRGPTERDATRDATRDWRRDEDSRGDSRYSARPRSRGGTKKNKKSLLSKYTRKIAHFKKVKTSHKKHKTTIKAHRKYSKKHRTYKK